MGELTFGGRVIICTQVNVLLTKRRDLLSLGINSQKNVFLSDRKWEK
jgi:hypothetical protein